MANDSSDALGVLIVDDSPFIRRLVADIVASTPGFRVAGEAHDGLTAIREIHALQPAVVTLDLEMPGLGGLDTLGYIMSEAPRPVVVLSGAESPAGQDLTVLALELGAVDFVRKPSWERSLDRETLARRLTQSLLQAARGRVQPPRQAPRRNWRRDTPHTSRIAIPEARRADHLLVLAASTGGPKVLSEVVPRLRLPPATVVLIVQHMPEHFTTSLARRLDELGPRPVAEVADRGWLQGGHVYVAPGGSHVVLTREAVGVQTLLSDAPAMHGVRPAVDVTLDSAASVFGAACTAVVLTGMGRDGARGAERVRASGGRVLAQTPDSCAVAGMPSAVLATGAATRHATPDELPDAIVDLCGWSRHTLEPET
jgi:two-component system chemotaxis response regulator CheB